MTTGRRWRCLSIDYKLFIIDFLAVITILLCIHRLFLEEQRLNDKYAVSIFPREETTKNVTLFILLIYKLKHDRRQNNYESEILCLHCTINIYFIMVH